jgi:response regulator RpfG family c-di-GMP phosphodiesterase
MRVSSCLGAGPPVRPIRDSCETKPTLTVVSTIDIPVLHISASFVDAEHKVRGLEGGADAYLSEPISQQELLATVRALLRLRQAQKEAQRQAADAEKARAELKKTNESLENRVLERTAELEHRKADVQELSRRCSKLKTTSDGGFPANSMTVRANCWLLSNSTSRD